MWIIRQYQSRSSRPESTPPYWGTVHNTPLNNTLSARDIKIPKDPKDPHYKDRHTLATYKKNALTLSFRGHRNNRVPTVEWEQFYLHLLPLVLEHPTLEKSAMIFFFKSSSVCANGKLRFESWTMDLISPEMMASTGFRDTWIHTKQNHQSKNNKWIIPFFAPSNWAYGLWYTVHYKKRVLFLFLFLAFSKIQCLCIFAFWFHFSFSLKANFNAKANAPPSPYLQKKKDQKIKKVDSILSHWFKSISMF